MQPLDRGHALGDGIGVILREISNRYFVTPHHRTAIDRKLPVASIHLASRVQEQRSQKRGLARTVAPHQRDSLAARDASRKAIDYFEVIVNLRQSLNFQRM